MEVSPNLIFVNLKTEISLHDKIVSTEVVFTSAANVRHGLWQQI